MKYNIVSKKAVEVLAVLASITIACETNDKRSDSTATNATDTKSQTVEDASQTLIITLDSGAGLESAAGALPAGTTATLGGTDAPSEFADATSGDNSAASVAIELNIEDGQGQPVVATGSIILSIPYSSDTTALTKTTPLSPSLNHLVALLRDSSGGLSYWRQGSYQIDETTKIVKLTTSTSGIYQLAYIVTDNIPGFDTATAKSKSTDLSAFGICDLTKITDAPPICWGYFGKIYENDVDLKSAEAACSKFGGTFQQNAACPRQGQLGVCALQYGTEFEYANYFYDLASNTDNGQSGCEISAENKWFKPGSYSPSKSDKSKTITTDLICGGQAVYGGCQMTGYCFDYIGSSFKANGEASCQTGTYLSDGCPQTNKVGCCSKYRGTELEVMSVGYSPDYTSATAEANCEGVFVP